VVDPEREARLNHLERRSRTVCRHLDEIPGGKASVVFGPDGLTADVARMNVTPPETGKATEEVGCLLKTGDPAIWTTHGNGAMTVGVSQLAPGQDELVGRRISEVLRK